MIKSASSVCSLEFVEHPVDSIIVVEVVTVVLPDKLACVVRGIFVVISNKSGLDVDVNSVFGITIGEVAVVVDLDVDDNVANSCVVSGVAEVGFLGSDETLSELDTASVDSVVTGNSLLNSIVDTTVLGSTVEVLKAISEIVGTKSNVIDTGTAVDSTDVAGRAVVDTTVSGIVSVVVRHWHWRQHFPMLVTKGLIGRPDCTGLDCSVFTSIQFSLETS